MPTTPNMSLVLPTEDASDDLWDTLLNAALTLVDLHDHTTGAGVAIPTAGLGIDADLPFAGFAATGLKAIDFNAVTALSAGYLTSLFVNSADSELYWRTAGGTNVQVTSGSSLNASLLGGITGDYGSGDEEVNYSAGSSIYNFLVDDSPALRAFIDCADIRLFEATGGVTNAVKLKSPAALAASYTITLPNALPASQRMLLISSTGQVSATNNVTAAVTMSSTLGVTGATTLTSLTTAGQLVIGGEITPSNLSSSTNNYAPTGLSTAAVILQGITTSLPLTGLTGGAAGRVIVLRNNAAAASGFDLSLLHESGSSTDVNRFHLPSGSTVAIPPQGSVVLRYGADRWYLAAKGF